jgi:hypothetical protein
MTWNFRITEQVHHFPLGGKKRKETIYAIREVYYNKKGKQDGYTMNAIALDGHSSKKELIECLEIMLRDAKKAPVLKIEDSHAGGPCGHCGRGFNVKDPK